jgi:hypothetical protein
MMFETPRHIEGSSHMPTMTLNKPINAADGDYAERAGKEHLKRIRTELDVAGKGYDPNNGSPVLVAINVVDGEYVTGTSDRDVINKFRVRFGRDSIGWIADLAD